MYFDDMRMPTRLEFFLSEMDHVIPAKELLAAIETHYPTSGRRGRPSQAAVVVP